MFNTDEWFTIPLLAAGRFHIEGSQDFRLMVTATAVQAVRDAAGDV
jgi:hypothetical protein